MKPLVTKESLAHLRTAEEAHLHAILRLIEQGGPAFEPSVGCRYRLGEGSSLRACGVGQLMTDEAYEACTGKTLAAHSAPVVMAVELSLPTLTGIKHLSVLQRWHDGPFRRACGLLKSYEWMHLDETAVDRKRALRGLSDLLSGERLAKAQAALTEFFNKPT